MSTPGVLRCSFQVRGRRSKRAASLPAADVSSALSSWLGLGVQDFVSLHTATGPRYYIVCESEVIALGAAARLHMTPCGALRGLRVAVVALEGESRAALLAGRAGSSSAQQSFESREAALAAAEVEEVPRPQASAPSNCASLALPCIPGMLLVTEWVTREEEASLVAALDGSAGWSGQIASRRVLHFGYAFDYVTRRAVGPEDTEVLGLSQGPLPMPPLAAAGEGSIAQMFSAVASLGLVGRAECSAPAQAGGGGKAAAPSGGLDGLALGEPLVGPQALRALAIAHPSPAAALNQATVNDYPAGKGISSHVDNHAAFLDGLAALSLLSGTVMEFSRGSDTRLVFLPPRSLLILLGEARLQWRHGITDRSTDSVDGTVVPRSRRLSVTMRGVRVPHLHGPCRCPFRLDCSDQDGGAAEPEVLMSPLLKAQRRSTTLAAGTTAAPTTKPPAAAPPYSSSSSSSSPPPTSGPPLGTPQIETDHVHALYDAIAPHFSSTRHSPWPRVARYVQALPPGALLLDAGCGNGKYLGLARARGLHCIGYDRCAGLVDICRERGHEAFVGDALQLPVREGTVDACLSIAVLHHISTRERRVGVLRNLLRALRPGGGQLLLYAWAKDQGEDSRRRFEGADVLVPWCLKTHFLSAPGGGDAAAAAAAPPSAPPLPPQLPPGAMLDEERGLLVLQRFCHVYVAGELEVLLGEAAAALGGSLELLAHPEPEVLGGGAGGPPATAPATKSSQRSSQEDPLTSKLVAQASRLTLPTGSALRAGSSDDGRAPATFKLLLSWWEADNWCVLVERV